MPRCPNCNYILLLLEHRLKYKCAKCSRLFFQKIIDDKDFRTFNIKQRNQDKKEYQKELEKRLQICKEMQQKGELADFETVEWERIKNALVHQTWPLQMLYGSFMSSL